MAGWNVHKYIEYLERSAKFLETNSLTLPNVFQLTRRLVGTRYLSNHYRTVVEDDTTVRIQTLSKPEHR